MPDDVSALLQDHPWLLLLVVIVVVFKFVGQALAESSESWSKVLGPIGRRWRTRGVRRVNAHQAERQKIAQELRKQIAEDAEARRAAEAADLSDMRRQTETLERLLRNMTELLALHDDYLAYVARWHRDTSLHAAAAGWVFPPPDHMSFLEFVRIRESATPGTSDAQEVNQ